MKKEKAFILFTLLITVLAINLIIAQDINCTDSDSGKDYNVSGIAEYNDTTCQDSCSIDNNNTLIECFCSDAQTVDSEEYVCPDSCDVGACIIVPDDDNQDENETDDSDCEWDCSKWSDCVDGKQIRTCDNLNNCGGEPQTEKRCKSKKNTNEKPNQGIGRELSQMIRERKAEIRSGDYVGPQGQLLRVREIVRGLKGINVDGVEAQTDLNVTAEIGEGNKTILKVKLRNGKEKEIKVMPNTAREKALKRFKLKHCTEENNCTIELTETGKGNNMKPSYEIQIERHSRILGIFAKKMKVSAQVDAETGEIIKTKKPWWAFIAREPQE